MFEEDQQTNPLTSNQPDPANAQITPPSQESNPTIQDNASVPKESSPLTEQMIPEQASPELPAEQSFSNQTSSIQEDMSLAEISSSAPASQSSKPMESMPTSQFDTPEAAKREIIETATKTGGSTEEELYVMSDKFKKTKSKIPGKKAGRLNFLIIILVLFLIIIGVAGFYLWTRGFFSPKTEVKPVAETEEISGETVLPEEETEKSGEETEKPKEELLEEEIEEEPIFLEKTLIKEFKNETEEVVSFAEFYLPEDAMDSDVGLSMETEPLTEEYEKDYKIIGGLYRFFAQKLEGEETQEVVDLVFKKPCNLKIFYTQYLIEEEWQSDLAIGYFKDDIWTIVPSFFSEDKTTLIVNDLEHLPADIWAIIIEKGKTLPKVETFQIAPNIPASLDADKDGLTDVEEGIFKTEINNPDSDIDGNPDGQEIINLNDPTQINEITLAASGLINVYTNPTYSYSFFYPASWLARAIPETDNQEILVITNTGEFFSVTVENNSENLSPRDWYLRQSPHVDESSLYSTLVNTQEAVWNPEHSTIYINKDNKIYIISYNVGTEEEANFKTTFEMLINSFQFVVQPQGRPDGTLIKYSDQPGVYFLESNKKRAFASGEIFEKLGFKWEDIIEIPDTETYIDGELIIGRLNGTLIKYPDQPGVYLIQEGQKRVFASGEIFENLGFKWEEVIEISVDEVYPDGPIINSNVTTSQIQ